MGQGWSDLSSLVGGRSLWSQVDFNPGPSRRVLQLWRLIGLLCNLVAPRSRTELQALCGQVPSDVPRSVAAARVLN